MAIEIERKFLVRSDAWRDGSPGLYCRQGYLAASSAITLRIRALGDAGFVTIKGKTKGISRLEYEYSIPYADAVALIDGFCAGAIVEKRRYTVRHGGLEWEVDEFLGQNKGLVLAEVELQSEAQTVDLPAWVGAEVSLDFRYHSSSLARRPYSEWRHEVSHGAA